MIWRPVLAIIGREVLRMVRQRWRLLSALARPMIWLLVIGSGVNSMLGEVGSEDYQHFLAPGVLGMVILFGAVLVSLSVVYDKEFGVMRSLIVAPLQHYWIVLAKTISAAVVAVIQAGGLVLLLVILGYIGKDTSILLLVTALLATALACASMGMLIAVWCSTLDNFAVTMNFVIFPVFFLSGALYPVQKLPDVLRLVATANPFTYGVDLLKHAILGRQVPIFGADFSVTLDLTVLLGFTVIAVFVACLRFSHESSTGLLNFLRD